MFAAASVLLQTNNNNVSYDICVYCVLYEYPHPAPRTLFRPAKNKNKKFGDIYFYKIFAFICPTHSNNKRLSLPHPNASSQHWKRKTNNTFVFVQSSKYTVASPNTYICESSVRLYICVLIPTAFGVVNWSYGVAEQIDLERIFGTRKTTLSSQIESGIAHVHVNQ